MSEAKIIQWDEAVFAVSLKCDDCNFALTFDSIPEWALKTAEEGLRLLIHHKHSCPSKSDDKK